MKSWILESPAPIEEKPLQLADLPLPEPKQGEVRIKILTCGICRTDLHLAEGEIALPKLPITPGHQVVGIIDKLGVSVSNLQIGERVGVPWIAGTCGTCWYCQDDKENLCDHGKFTGQHVDGGFAEYMIARAMFVFPIPRFFDEVKAAPLLCGGTIGYRALKLAQVPARGKLGLYGFGSSAHITAKVAENLGAETFVVTRGEAGQEHARRLGAKWAGGPEESVPSELDAAIIFAAAGELVERALLAVKKGGFVVCAGIHMSEIEKLSYRALYGERVLRSVTNSTRADVRELLEMAARQKLIPDTTEFDFDHLNEHLLSLKRGEYVGTGVVRVARAEF